MIKKYGWKYFQIQKAQYAIAKAIKILRDEGLDALKLLSDDEKEKFLKD